MSSKNMREIDTETPVIWPAWCYTGEASLEDTNGSGSGGPQLTTTTQIGSSAIHTNNINNNSNNNIINSGKLKVKRGKSTGTASYANTVDKMLSDRMMNITENRKYCDNTNSLYYDTSKAKCELNMDVIRGGGGGGGSGSSGSDNDITINNNNNNNIKQERLSPQNGDIMTSNSRSRSITPSSYPGTPPQAMNCSDNLHVSTGVTGNTSTAKSDFHPRNYSDFIRSLAAKYNNTNPNELNNQQRPLFESNKYGMNSPKIATKESQSTPDSKRLPTTTNVTPGQLNQNNLMSSIFSGIPFPTTVFSPLIDMSSTQALMALARAAKEAELQSLLKSNNNNNTFVKMDTNPSAPNTAGRSNSTINSTISNSTSKTPNIHFSPSQSFMNTSTPITTITTTSSSSSISATTSATTLPTTIVNNINNSNLPSTLHNRHSPSASGVSATILSSSNSSSSESVMVPLSPLDLSAAAPVSKRLKLESPSPSRSLESPISHHPQQQQQQQHQRSKLGGGQRKCQSQCDEINSWTVDQVCDFVNSIDICAEYTENFREQRIDGTGLPLLTEDHLMNSLGMKLGPALKLRSVLAKKSGGPCPCVSCSISANAQSPAGSIPRPSSVDSG